jgi:quercetin dioxygenase-like cupin family protein
MCCHLLGETDSARSLKCNWRWVCWEEKGTLSVQTKVIHSGTERLFNVFGPLHQFLVDPADTSGAFGLMRAAVPPGVAVPLHSHADPEVFFVLEGLLDVLQYDDSSNSWLTAGCGDIICIPGGVKHSIRNSSSAAVTVLLATTPNLYEFLRELGGPFNPEQKAGPPTHEDMQRLLALAAKYGYWIASPEENEVVGLIL